MKRTFHVLLLILAMSVTQQAAFPRVVQAMHPDARALVTGGLYGMAAGTVAGLLTLPFSGDSRTVFIGTSVGLYLGMALGIYYASHRDDPANPLRKTAKDVEESGRDDSRERPTYLSRASFNPVFIPSPPAAWVEVAYPVLRF